MEVMNMSTNWQGYLFKAVKTNEEFPDKYINAESWESLPNSREEIKAYRDDNSRNLHRITATGHKTSITFKTRPNLTLEDKIAIQKFFTDAEAEETDSTTAHRERKVQLRYWNDEENVYKTSYFYRPDIKFTIRKITNDTIIYKEIEIGLVEY